MFSTKERDESTGLDNFGFRYYDSELGRFITRDPSGYPDGFNNQLYVNNNPINFIDPLGLEISDEEEAKRKAEEKARQEKMRQKANRKAQRKGRIVRKAKERKLKDIERKLDSKVYKEKHKELESQAAKIREFLKPKKLAIYDGKDRGESDEDAKGKHFEAHAKSDKYDVVIDAQSAKQAEEEVRKKVAQGYDISDVSFLDHGSPGEQELGNGSLSVDQVANIVKPIENLSNIHLNGCNVAAYGVSQCNGRTFMKWADGPQYMIDIANKTGASVYAYTGIYNYDREPNGVARGIGYRLRANPGSTTKMGSRQHIYKYRVDSWVQKVKMPGTITLNQALK